MRLLVIKHGALGDIMQGLDAFASLRAHFDTDHITVLTGPSFAGLMRAMPYFDDVLVDPRASFLHVRELLRIRAIFKQDFDIIIDMQCSKRTAHYHRFFAPKARRWLGTAPNCSDAYPDFTAVNNRDRMLYAARYLGAEEAHGDLSFLAKTAANDVGSLPPHYAVLLPGCSPAKPSKRWPASHYAQLADELFKAGITPVIAGTKLDAAACDDIAASCPQAINLCDKTTLAALAHLCANAAVCIGNDSGPVFLAAKTGTKTLMVMGPDTNPFMSAPTGKNAHYLKVDDLSSLNAKDVMTALGFC